MDIKFDEKSYLDKEHKRLKKELQKVKKEGLTWKIELAEKALEHFEANH